MHLKIPIELCVVSPRVCLGCWKGVSRSDSNNYIPEHYQLKNLGYSRILFSKNKILLVRNWQSFGRGAGKTAFPFPKLQFGEYFLDFFFFFRPGMRSVIVGMGFTTLLEK